MTIRPTATPTPLDWAEAEAQIVHPTRGRMPFRAYPYQKAFFATVDQPRRIIVKARQIGFSQAFALEALHTAIHVPESTILFVSRSQDAAIHLLRYCYLTYQGLRHAPTLVKENEREMGLENGSRIKSIPANQSTGRSFGARRVYLDEFAYADYAEFIYQSIAPTLSHGGSLTIASTPNGSGNPFHDLYQGGENFQRFCVPWSDCPAYYTDAERARGVAPEESAWYVKERPNYAASVWAAEYDCDFTSSGLSLFSVADIDRASLPYDAPISGAWLTTVDVGRRHDATVINTFDVRETPYRRVAFERLERVPYPYIQQQIERTARRWPGRLVIESNGVGDPLLENLTVYAEPFLTTARSKLHALQALQLLFERGDIRADFDARERAALIAESWDADHTSDEVMSLALFAATVSQMGTPGI